MEELLAMDAHHIKFIVGDTFDVPLALQNLSQWMGKDGSCKLRIDVCWFKHILSDWRTSLSQG